jgi:hypothetical protein
MEHSDSGKRGHCKGGKLKDIFQLRMELPIGRFKWKDVLL